MSPRVAVGIPVADMAATVGRAIESIVGQTFADLVVLISDNASTDATGAICRRYAAGDARVRYTRRATRLDPWQNFRSLVEAARAPYFMWLAADDFARPALLERAVAVLDAHPEVVCVAPRVDFALPDGTLEPALGTFPLRGSVSDNLARFLHDPSDNCRFYGVFRREVLSRWLPASGYYAYDWAISVSTLKAGQHWELDERLLVRDANAPDKYTRSIDTAFRSQSARLLPLLRFTGDVLFRVRVPPTPRTLFHLARLNVVHHVMYARYRYPRYGRAVHRVTAGIERGLHALWRPR